jgi:hypothetical protein
MPYSIIKVKGGYQVTSPNHPEGHSKKPMTHQNAIAQMLIMQRAESGDTTAGAFKRYKNQKYKEPGE